MKEETEHAHESCFVIEMLTIIISFLIMRPFYNSPMTHLLPLPRHHHENLKFKYMVNTIHLHVVPRLRKHELFLPSPIHIHDMVLN
jgi:hypothetical protein